MGSSLLRLKTTGRVIDREEYYPFGDSSLRTFSSKRYRYVGKEKDAESGLYYYGARYYAPWLCRFISIDPKAAETQQQSPYNYCNNNPINLIDPDGQQAVGTDDPPVKNHVAVPDATGAAAKPLPNLQIAEGEAKKSADNIGAWSVKNSWNDDYINNFNDFVGQKAAEYGSQGKAFTCEDFALSIAIDFAKENQLPFVFTNETGTYDATSSDYTPADFDRFKNDVLRTSGAPDLQNNQNTTQVTLNNVGTGTIILNRNANNVATHIQIVSSVKDNFGYKDGIKTINIIQGNSGWLNNIRGGSYVGGSNPESSLYTGKPLERGFYLPQADYYHNWNSGKSYSNFSTVRNIEFRQFNFKGMNKP